MALEPRPPSITLEQHPSPPSSSSEPLPRDAHARARLPLRRQGTAESPAGDPTGLPYRRRFSRRARTYSPPRHRRSRLRRRARTQLERSPGARRRSDLLRPTDPRRRRKPKPRRRRLPACSRSVAATLASVLHELAGDVALEPDMRGRILRQPRTIENDPRRRARRNRIRQRAGAESTDHEPERAGHDDSSSRPHEAVSSSSRSLR
jgi:hypothetical protein